MNIREFVRNIIQNQISEQNNWFHGTPDSREVEKQGGFQHRTLTVDYVKDIEGLNQLQQKMKDARTQGDEDLYFELLDQVPSFKETYSYPKPIFLTNEYLVAKTYADPKRAFDYQNAEEKVYKIDVDCSNIVQINAFGDRFRFINPEKVKKGFYNAGVPEKEIEELIQMFNYYIQDNKGIQTDVIAAIGNWLNFDCIDVVGVLDSYEGGSIKSTVRMILDPTKVNIKK